jgi:hypothetical protein
VHDHPRSGRQSINISDDSVALVREVISVNRRLTLREISAEVGIMTLRAKPF